MIITRIYPEYFQKSRMFLYPLLDIANVTSNRPRGSFVAFENLQDPTQSIKAEDNKLIVIFDTNKTSPDIIQQNRFFERFLAADQGQFVALFNLAFFAPDMETFRKGRYSEFSQTLKEMNKAFYKEFSPEYTYVRSYLYPVEFHTLYAELLNVDLKIIQETHELCSKPDMEKELFAYKPQEVPVV